MGAHQQALSSIEGSQEKVLRKQEKLEHISIQRLKDSSQLQSDILDIRQIVITEHEKTREKIATNTPVVARRNNREIHFIGESREAILAPLLLIKDHVRQAVLHFVSHDTERVSPQHLYWLQSEFESLVSSATQEVAALSQGSTATPFDHWDYSQEGFGHSNSGARTRPRTLGADCKARDEVGIQRKRSGKANRRKRLSSSSYKFLSFESPVGQLYIAVPRYHGPSENIHQLEEVALSFIPTYGVCRTSIAARFVSFMETGSEPKLYAQINTHRLVEVAVMDACDDLFTGTIEELDAAFREGVISPYDSIELEGLEFNICLFVSCSESTCEFRQ